MASVSDILEYLGLRLVWLIANLLSARTADRFGAMMGRIVFSVYGSRREITKQNLKMALGDEYDHDRITAISKGVFENIGRTLIETCRLKKLGREGVINLIEADSGRIFEKIGADGKGALTLTAHFGNWELMGAWLATVGPQTSFLVATQHNSLVDKILEDSRASFGVDIIHTDSSLKDVFRNLRNGGFLVILADQHAPGESYVREFFGRPASIARGPALFSIRTGCPIVPLVLLRERYDRHVVLTAEHIYPPNSGDEEADVEYIMNRYTKFLETVIREHPEQWLWTHRRWKVDQARN